MVALLFFATALNYIDRASDAFRDTGGDDGDGDVLRRPGGAHEPA
jgi:hypothetical protein